MAEFIQADVLKVSEITALFAHIKKKYGRLDIAVNNAGAEGQVSLVDEQGNENFSMSSARCCCRTLNRFIKACCWANAS